MLMTVILSPMGSFAPFDWHVFMVLLGKLMLAYVLALPVGWERELASHSAGVRTFPLVAIASCGFVLMADGVSGGDAAARSRIIQGIAAGIGFVGGGAIMRSEANVHGTATAASIWNTAAIGTAVAISRFEIAVVLSIVNLLTLRLLLPIKRRISGHAPEEEE